MYCKLQIKLEDKIISADAIIDTGNFLRDPITKRPVIVIDKETLRGILPDDFLDNLLQIISGKDIDIGSYTSKIRLIPFTSLGKENGLLIGLKAEKAVISYNTEIINIDDVIIGIYNGVLSKTNKYSALVGIGIIDN